MIPRPFPSENLIIQILSCMNLFWAVLISTALSSAANASRPNVLLILADDLGYSDLQDPEIHTVVLNRLARTGVRLSNFYAQPSCGPSRAALMTGSNPARVGLNFDPLPGSSFGVHSGEFTLGEMFRNAGYRTGYFGKWHLGDRPEHSPLKHGFDRYFGIPVSNDMWPFHPRTPFRKGSPPDRRLVEAKKRVAITGGEDLNFPLPNPDFFPPLLLIDQESVIETNPEQSSSRRDLQPQHSAFWASLPTSHFLRWSPTLLHMCLSIRILSSRGGPRRESTVMSSKNWTFESESCWKRWKPTAR
jgi:Sulfatase